MNDLSFALSVNKFINENYANLSSIKDIANHFHISSVHLQRLYKSKTGESVWNYVNNKRAATAAYLLEYTDLSIESIVSLVGLNSRQTLYALFKKHYNTSPINYKHTKNHL